MVKKQFALLIALVGLLALVLPGAAQDTPFTFGLVLVGPKDDRGWSQAHYEGALYAQEQIPGSNLLVFESLNPADTPETTLADVVKQFVDEGATLIITSSDSFQEDTVKVAADYPDVTFINDSGDDVLKGTAPANLGNLMASSEWSRLIAGCAAALTTETGKIGYIGPLINNETRRMASSEYLGAKYCWENYKKQDPAKLEFEVTWIGFWFNIPGVTLDPTEEAKNFYNRGFDVVVSGIDTTEMVTVAGQEKEAGKTVWVQPYNSLSGCDTSPDNCLGMVYYNWGPSYAKIAQSVVDGTWEQSWDWVAPTFSDEEGKNFDDMTMTGYMPREGLSEENLAKLNEFIGEVKAFAADSANTGKIFLWDDAIELQDGTLLGEAAKDKPQSDTYELSVWYLPQILKGMVGASE
jgi:simple sugar transport system substrate-binding protein